MKVTCAVQLLAGKSKLSKECSQACKKWKGQDQRQHVTELGLLLGCHIALQWNRIKCCTAHLWG